MTNRQNAKLNEAQRVSDTLAKYSTVYTGIAPVVSAVNELNEHIADIRTVSKEQISVNVPASTQAKREAEGRMIDASIKMSNALYVIGFTTGDKDLTNLLGLSPNSFYKLEGNAKLALAEHIFEFVQKQSEALVSYGIDAEEVEATGKSIDAFRTLITKPMDLIGERKQKTTNLKQLFAGLDSVLYDKLDKLIVLFKASEPDFYGEYRTARNYIDSSARHEEMES